MDSPKHMELKNRIKAVCVIFKLSVREFERECQLNRGNISNMTGALGSDKISKIIARYPSINLYWLLTGEGEMFLSRSEKTGSDAPRGRGIGPTGRAGQSRNDRPSGEQDPRGSRIGRKRQLALTGPPGTDRLAAYAHPAAKRTITAAKRSAPPARRNDRTDKKQGESFVIFRKKSTFAPRRFGYRRLLT